jgi:hypothetical protein
MIKAVVAGFNFEIGEKNDKGCCCRRCWKDG